MGMYSGMMKQFVPPSKEYNERFQERLKKKQENQAAMDKMLADINARHTNDMALEKAKITMQEALTKKKFSEFEKKMKKMAEMSGGGQQGTSLQQPPQPQMPVVQPQPGEAVMSLPGGRFGDFQGQEVAQPQPQQPTSQQQPQVPTQKNMPAFIEGPSGGIVKNPYFVSPFEREKYESEEIRKQQKSKAAQDKAILKQQEDEEVKQARIDNEKGFSQDMLDTISEVEGGIKYFGAAGRVPPWPAEYKKVRWRANFDKLISKRVLKVMANMKKQSKTGATGFGQLSEKELAILKNASTALKTNMSEEDAQKYLDKMKEPLFKILSSIEKGQPQFTKEEIMAEMERRRGR